MRHIVDSGGDRRRWALGLLAGLAVGAAGIAFPILAGGGVLAILALLGVALAGGAALLIGQTRRLREGSEKASNEIDTISRRLLRLEARLSETDRHATADLRTTLAEVSGEIALLGGLIKDLAVTVAAHDREVVRLKERAEGSAQAEPASRAASPSRPLLAVAPASLRPAPAGRLGPRFPLAPQPLRPEPHDDEPVAGRPVFLDDRSSPASRFEGQDDRSSPASRSDRGDERSGPASRFGRGNDRFSPAPTSRFDRGDERLSPASRSDGGEGRPDLPPAPQFEGDEERLGPSSAPHPMGQERFSPAPAPQPDGRGRRIGPASGAPFPPAAEAPAAFAPVPARARDASRST